MRDNSHRSVPFRERITATVRETCAATDIGKTTLYGLIRQGKITATTVGGRRLILVKSVLALLEEAA